MSQNADNPVWARLRSIRQTLAQMQPKTDAPDEKIAHHGMQLRSGEDIPFGLAGYTRSRNLPVEHLETKLRA